MAQTMSRRPAKAAKKPATKPTLLSGGNPQIAKGDGDGPCSLHRGHARLETGRRTLPRRPCHAYRPRRAKAVKWNSPFYGVEDQDGWFLSFHCFTKYVKSG